MRTLLLVMLLVRQHTGSTTAEKRKLINVSQVLPHLRFLHCSPRQFCTPAQASDYQVGPVVCVRQQVEPSSPCSPAIQKPLSVRNAEKIRCLRDCKRRPCAVRR